MPHDLDSQFLQLSIHLTSGFDYLILSALTGIHSLLPVNNFAIEFAGSNFHVVLNLLNGDIQAVFYFSNNLRNRVSTLAS